MIDCFLQSKKKIVRVKVRWFLFGFAVLFWCSHPSRRDVVVDDDHRESITSVFHFRSILGALLQAAVHVQRTVLYCTWLVRARTVPYDSGRYRLALFVADDMRIVKKMIRCDSIRNNTTTHQTRRWVRDHYDTALAKPLVGVKYDFNI